MKVVVCVKPVKTELVYPNERREEKYVMNPYDIHALEKSLALKKVKDCTVTCICMGPNSAEPMLKKALAMGADDAVLLSDKAFIGSDTVATSYILYCAIIKIGGADIVVCGNRSVDGETGQVVHGVSERLNYYCVQKVDSIEEAEESFLYLVHGCENKTVHAKVKMPVVLSYADFKVNQPIINMLALKRAKGKLIRIMGAKELEVDEKKCGTQGSKTKVLNAKKNIATKNKVFVEGTSPDKAKVLIDILEA